MIFFFFFFHYFVKKKFFIICFVSFLYRGTFSHSVWEALPPLPIWRENPGTVKVVGKQRHAIANLAFVYIPTIKKYYASRNMWMCPAWITQKSWTDWETLLYLFIFIFGGTLIFFNIAFILDLSDCGAFNLINQLITLTLFN